MKVFPHLYSSIALAKQKGLIVIIIYYIGLTSVIALFRDAFPYDRLASEEFFTVKKYSP